MGFDVPRGGTADIFQGLAEKYIYPKLHLFSNSVLCLDPHCDLPVPSDVCHYNPTHQ